MDTPVRLGGDVATCDREPIQIPGGIQPHGALLVFLDGACVSASANAGELLGRPAQDCTGGTLDGLLGKQAGGVLDRRLQTPGSAGLTPVRLTLDGRDWLAIAHRHAGLSLVELEPCVPAPANVLGHLDQGARALRQAETETAACQAVADAVQALSGMDRVMLYRFAPDWSGEVLAEAAAPGWGSYLGLHFPASDIPAQARALYQANPVRLIARSSYVPVPLVPDRDPQTGGPIDLSFAALRSVSPVHLEYLRNMGVAASMSVSVLRDGALWGLVACHHRAPRLIGYEVRQACVLLAGLLADRLGGLERAREAAPDLRLAALHTRLVERQAAGVALDDALAAEAGTLMGLLDAHGMALVLPDGPRVAGSAPDAGVLQALADWIATDSAGCFATDRLGTDCPAMQPHASLASGALAIVWGERTLLWFRPEQARIVRWAGAPQKAVREEAGQTTLHPRASFEAWTEQVRGRSLPWTPAELRTAARLRALVLDLAARERDGLERRALDLARGNRELENFIHVASHDIKEPLRQMEMLAGLMAGVAGDAAETAEYLSEFRTIGARLRRLTESLASYARPGGPGWRPEQVDLDELIRDVVLPLRRALGAAGAEVAVRPLPRVVGEPAQLHLLFTNLIGNALKYREPTRPLRVRIGVVADTLGGAEAGAGPMVAIEVADNGIGFDPRHAHRLFDAFVRLHSRDRYEGSGLGLAICRRIIARHGGRIEAAGKPGLGATFTLTLRAA